ncbi:MAG: carbamate kinase [Firmicutes bacterium]|nr:carbamate kinase [Bacillota bacterium]
MKIVLTLGGNALGSTLPEQMAAVKETSKAIVDLIEAGHRVVISHGNGPQVGMIKLMMGDMAPISVCVGMSQGYIGYDLQNALREEMLGRGLTIPVCSLITQVLVDGDDPAFLCPTKPIGRFYTVEEAEKLGEPVREDAGRGWRRVVASPRPIGIVEIETIRALAEAGQVVIAAGGGGIPVIAEGNHLRGAKAVIDKDFASSLMARELGADMLIILTAVEKVALHFGKPAMRRLDSMTPQEARGFMLEGHFAQGSMLPKVQAAVEFVESGPGRKALITLLEKARDGIEGRTGTVIAHTNP